MRYKLTDDDVDTIRDAIAQTEGVRAAHRWLLDHGHNYGYGSVQRTYHEVAEAVNTEARLAASQAEVRSLRSQLGYTKRQYGMALEVNDQILGAISALPPPARVVRPKSTDSQTPCVVVAPVADWHYAEVIRLDDTGGINSFNRAVAVARVQYLVRKFLRWVEVERRGHELPECHIPVLGDMITGDIHDELVAYAEVPTPQAVVEVSRLLAWYIRQVSTSFQRTAVHFVKVDNHSRLTRKPQTKRRGTNSWNHVICALLRELLRDNPQIDIVEYESPRAEIKIGDAVYLAGHGDGVRANFGLPHYGFTRQDGHLARQFMSQGKRFDERLRGHWHVAEAGVHGILCGCLCGMSEFNDQRTSLWTPAAQVSFIVHPRHGWYNFTRWHLGCIQSNTLTDEEQKACLP